MNEDPGVLPDEEEDLELPEWEPETGIPTLDNPDITPSYQDWSPETTKVVSGPLGAKAKFPGQRFATRGEARTYWQQRAGRIFEEHLVKNRYVFRVRRDA
jgi:hypothetical protein